MPKKGKIFYTSFRLEILCDNFEALLKIENVIYNFITYIFRCRINTLKKQLAGPKDSFRRTSTAAISVGLENTFQKHCGDIKKWKNINNNKIKFQFTNFRQILK